MVSSIERFSNRVANYVRYRPDYPKQILEFLAKAIGFSASWSVADIGSGTGLSSRLFLENGNVVFGIEPNTEMRRAAAEFLSDFQHFQSVNGTAENTGLDSDSIDLVIAAQAFHWFDRRQTRVECRRILRHTGYVALLWNERQLDTTSFLRDYEQFLTTYGTDYSSVRHENISPEILIDFFGAPYAKATFSNIQTLDFEGLRGRVLSASYIPSETDCGFDEMIAELRLLFEKHAEQGKIEIIYDTNVYYAQV